jgi:transposase
MLLLVLADEIASVEIDLHTRLRHHPGYCNLLKVKGIGPTLAAVFIAEIGDVTRFPTAGALCCWAGLTRGTTSRTRPCTAGTSAKKATP